MTDDSARLGLPYVMAGQLQKHVTVNEAFTRLDAMVQTAVVSRSRSAPPAVATEGDLYLVGPGPTGDWSVFAEGHLIRADTSGWVKMDVTPGMMVTVLDEGVSLLRLNDQWQGLGEALGGVLQVEKLGIGTAPDATNPFSARINKALWAACPTDDGGDGDLRFTFNKQAPDRTGSILFQSQWSGRAEIGLMGDDDLRVKVSANGNGWFEALRIDRSNGRVWFPTGASRRETTVLTANTTVSVPTWARWVEAVCVGGGGAGGAGMSGSVATQRHGGGGGGAGGVCTALWPSEHLGALIVVVGTGGATSGANGTATTIATYSNTILNAEGGKGGVSAQGGAGGWGSDAQASNGLPTTQPAAPFSAGGGGAGGSLSSANVVGAASAGGAGHPRGVSAPGGTAGQTEAGNNGAQSPLPNLAWLGGGGGGGGAAPAGNGYAGGHGANYGAGGGGGGAGLTGAGPGGSGAAGIVHLTFVG